MLDLIRKYIVEIIISSFMMLLAIVACFLDYTFIPMENEDIVNYYKREYEYPVISVSQYMKVTKRSCFGTILREEPCYKFTYIEDDGSLHEFIDFQNTEYGLWKVCLGEKNKYIIREDGIDTYRYLYLTEETLINMKGVFDWTK